MAMFLAVVKEGLMQPWKYLGFFVQYRETQRRLDFLWTWMVTRGDISFAYSFSSEPGGFPSM